MLGSNLYPQNRYTKKPRQPPLPPLQLRAAVVLITVPLLTLLIPLPLFMGWWNFCYYEDFIFW